MIPWLIADLHSFSYNPMKYGHFYVIRPNPSSFNEPNNDIFSITHLAKNTVWSHLIFQHDQAWNFHVDHAIGHIWIGSGFIIDRQNGWSFSTRLEFNPATSIKSSIFSSENLDITTNSTPKNSKEHDSQLDA